jgi:hypothetical protein
MQEMSYLDRVVSGEGIEAGYIISCGYATADELCALSVLKHPYPCTEQIRMISKPTNA